MRLPYSVRIHVWLVQGSVENVGPGMGWQINVADCLGQLQLCV